MRRLASCWAELTNAKTIAQVATAKSHKNERTKRTAPGLLTDSRLAPFSNQFVNQRRTRFYVAPNQTLSVLDPHFQGRDAQFVILKPQHEFVSRIDAQSLTKGCRNYNLPPCADTNSTLVLHVLATLQMNDVVL